LVAARKHKENDMREIKSLAELKSLVGTQVASSDWISISQERVNTFADATGDHQWIHIDVERAKKESPFGGPIAHGFLTSLCYPC
jgi:acyl dehydratase